MSSLTDWFRNLLTDVGQFQLDHQERINPSTTDHKGRIDLVTDVDRESENRLVKALRDKFPEDGIMAEEEHRQQGSNDRCWIIDPLDGTTNYVHHHPFFGISVGLQEGDELTAGYTYFPVFESFYCAEDDGPALKNGDRIQASQTTEPINSLLATGFADIRTDDSRYNLPIFNELIKNVQGIRRGGSAVHDLCMVAEGVFEGFWEFNLEPWDVAAGAVIIRAAGGTVTDMTGADHWLEGHNIVASNGGFHGTVLNWLEPHLPEYLG